MARRWATGIVVVVALAAGGLGGAYIWREAFPTNGDASDAGIADAARDAKARGKSAKKNSGKKGGRPSGKPRPRPPGGPAANPQQPQQQQGDDDPGADSNDDDNVVDFQPPFRGRGPAGPTYEAAIASNKQDINIGSKSGPDLTDQQINGPMQSGHFVGECGAPDAMKVTVRVAIKLGRPVGVSVSTSPGDPDIAGCIDRYVRTFSWPSSPKMDSFTTTY